MPLRKWFSAIYLCTAHKKGISSYQLSRDIGVTQKTAWFMLGRIREMMKEKAPERLSGTVEADETYIGGRHINKHKGKEVTEKAMVVGVLERGGKVITEAVKKVKKGNNDIVAFVNHNVHLGSELMTDEARHYIRMGRRYEHNTVHHAIKEFVRGRVHTQGIENYWSLLKRGIVGIYHQVSPKHLHRYCDEFAYRYNSRKVNDQERFINSFTRLTNGVLTYKQYIAND